MFSSLLATLIITPLEFSPRLMWCAKESSHTHISYCFEKKTECNTFSFKKQEEFRNKKIFTCHPTKV